MRYLNRRRAAEYLTERGIDTTAQGLADRAHDDTGPKYAIINGRALYTEAGLDAWIAAQAARPIRRKRESAEASA